MGTLSMRRGRPAAGFSRSDSRAVCAYRVVNARLETNFWVAGPAFEVQPAMMSTAEEPGSPGKTPRARAPQTPQTPRSTLPRAVAPDSARSAASTAFAASNSESAASPPSFSMASARHTVLHPGRASHCAASSEQHAASVAAHQQRDAVQQHAVLQWCDSDDEGSIDGSRASTGCSEASGTSSQRAVHGKTARHAPPASSASAADARLAAPAVTQQPQRAAPCVASDQVRQGLRTTSRRGHSARIMSRGALVLATTAMCLAICALPCQCTESVACLHACAARCTCRYARGLGRACGRDWPSQAARCKARCIVRVQAFKPTVPACNYLLRGCMCPWRRAQCRRGLAVHLQALRAVVHLQT